MFDDERNVLGNAQQTVKQRGVRQPLVMKINPGKGSVSNLSSAL